MYMYSCDVQVNYKYTYWGKRALSFARRR
jgi:hypothetical protein